MRIPSTGPVTSPQLSQTVPLGDWHCAGRGRSSPAAITPAFRHAQRSHRNSVTPRKPLHLNASNHRSGPTHDFGRYGRSPQGCARRQALFPAATTVRDTVKDLCKELKLSWPSVDTDAAASQTDPERRSKLLQKKRSVVSEITFAAEQHGGVFTNHQDDSFRETMYKFGRSDGSKNTLVGGMTENDVARLQQSAAMLKMSADDVFLAKSVFDSYDLRCTGTLSVTDFEKVVTELLEIQLCDKMIPVPQVQKLCEQFWADADGCESVAFDDFLRWYSQTLRANDLVTESEWRNRISSEWDMSSSAVEHLKHCFDLHAKGGCIDLLAFKHVLHKALRVPTQHELPSCRVAWFFNVCDNNQSGLIAFDEFLAWWARYFHGCADVEEHDVVALSSTKPKMPYEDFYRRLRPMSGMTPDPPCYYNGVLVSELLVSEDFASQFSAGDNFSRQASRCSNEGLVKFFSRQLSKDSSGGHLR